MASFPMTTSPSAPDRIVHDVDAQQAAYFESMLADAELLLKFAADRGYELCPELRADVLRARDTPRELWDVQTGTALLDALTKLSSQLKPVTAESLRACSDEQRTVNGYWKIAAVLALIIVPFSVASFVGSALSDAIHKDIVTANDLAVKLTAQLQVGTEAQAANQASLPAATQRPDISVVDVVTELQQFASTIRSIDARARQLKTVLIVFAPEDPFAGMRRDPERVHELFELPSNVLSDLQTATLNRIKVFQQVRYFAQSGVDDVSLFYGAIATCVLPLLYALLGTCAYLLRSTEDDLRNRTYIPSSADSARFLMAGIGGAVVGLFNNFTITQGASIPPLALAFLVGYAVDVFFSFLEGMLQTFTRPKAASATTPSHREASAS
ncbi:MAG TPA: hypothetical protein VFA27_17255 [Vicinamibacterales bacterium]|nr:hypothetical protein [Vicinamibacterales bacterium]